MLIIGLTGSIGMGKTTAATDFQRLGIFVHNADMAVHELMGNGGRAVRAVATAFPGVQEGGAINRTKLGDVVFRDTDRLRVLEAILHPMVLEHRSQFLMTASRYRRPMVVLDIPLLFETGGDLSCDAVVTVSAPTFVQYRRVLARPGMNKERLFQILAKQMSDKEKRRRSDFIVPTGQGRLVSFRSIRKIVLNISNLSPKHWPPWVAGRGAVNI